MEFVKYARMATFVRVLPLVLHATPVNMEIKLPRAHHLAVKSVIRGITVSVELLGVGVKPVNTETRYHRKMNRAAKTAK